LQHFKKTNVLNITFKNINPSTSLENNNNNNNNNKDNNQVQPLLARFNNSLERYSIEVATCHLGGLLFSKAILLAFNHSSLQSITI
jgi:Tfp pilus assembly protein PilP